MVIKSGSQLCVETREQLSLYVRRKWLSMHPDVSCEPVDVDDDLTNLDWLSNFSMNSAVSSACDSAPVVYNPPSPQPVEPRNDPYAKPALSYTTLIRTAIMSFKDQRATISDIYSWITENYPYYSLLPRQSWQNSVRHSLSLNKSFQKVARSKGDPGKGSFWCYVPDGQDPLFSSKRFYTSDPMTAPSWKCCKREVGEAVSTILDQSSPCSEVAQQFDPTTVSVKTEPEDLSLNYSQGPIINQDVEICGVKVTINDLLEGQDFLTDNFLDLSASADVDMGVHGITDMEEDSDVGIMSPICSGMDTADLNLYDEHFLGSNIKTADLTQSSANLADTKDCSFQNPAVFSSPYKSSYTTCPTESLDLEDALAFFDC